MGGLYVVSNMYSGLVNRSILGELRELCLCGEGDMRTCLVGMSVLGEILILETKCRHGWVGGRVQKEGWRH